MSSGVDALVSGWEGNRRSGVTLAMRIRISSYKFSGLRKTGEHPA